jgi:hypothetical protein
LVSHYEAAAHEQGASYRWRSGVQTSDMSIMHWAATGAYSQESLTRKKASALQASRTLIVRSSHLAQSLDQHERVEGLTHRAFRAQLPTSGTRTKRRKQ